MINTADECRDFALQLRSRMREGRYHECMEQICTLRRAGEIGNRFSVRSLAEAMIFDQDGASVGHRLTERMDRSRQGGVLMEAGGDTLTTAHFANILGQIAFADTLTAHANVQFIGDQLVTEIPADTQFRVMMPGITMIGDQSQDVGEGEEYPIVGVGKQYIELPEIGKEGFIVAATEELIREDKTAQLLSNLNKAADSMALSREKERISVATGITNTYKRNGGPIQNTYGNTHTQGDFDNLIATNPLLDYESIEASDLAFSGITDPDTAEPIAFTGPRRMLVPEGLWVKAWRMANASTVRTGDLTAAEIEMTTGNPLAARGGDFQPLTSPYVASIDSSETTWFRGDFKGAFVERVYWPIQTFVEDRNSGVGFSRDIVFRLKVRRKTVVAVREPRLVQKHTA